MYGVIPGIMLSCLLRTLFNIRLTAVLVIINIDVIVTVYQIRSDSTCEFHYRRIMHIFMRREYFSIRILSR